jgi:integrase
MSLKLTRRGKIWHIAGTVAGRRIRQSTGLSDRKSADLYRARIETQARARHTLGRRATLTFAEAALTYLESGGEGRFLGRIIEHFGPDFLLADLNNEALQSAASALYPNAADNTINRQLITPAAAVYNMAADDELAPAKRFRKRKEPKGRMRWLTPAEAAALITHAPAHIRPLILFLLGTGCRPVEAFALDRADLHLDDCEAWIAKSKTDRPRMVRFPLIVRRALAVADLPDLGPVFRTPKGAPYKIARNRGGQMQTAFNAARTAAGLGPDVTPYVLRHTWATWFHGQTKDFGALMDLGGWQRADTANIYRKMAPASLARDLLAHGWDFSDDATHTPALAPAPAPLKTITR